MVFGDGRPSGDQLDLLYLMDTYLQRPDPRWAELLARAAMTALSPARVESFDAARAARTRLTFASAQLPARKSSTALLNSSGSCQKAKWLTFGRMTSFAPE